MITFFYSLIDINFDLIAEDILVILMAGIRVIIELAAVGLKWCTGHMLYSRDIEKHETRNTRALACCGIYLYNLPLDTSL
jgi:hypothetical protein